MLLLGKEGPTGPGMTKSTSRNQELQHACQMHQGGPLPAKTTLRSARRTQVI